ncbi:MULTISPECIES: hypothetical protein [Actinosynnema]|uniref:WXG100-like domain-containing protein n=1 Tax=Actinosynnema TaxID=40566 RepID=UPI0020A2B91D|nr:hypothetical protein [Actinosynnema pretiosum]MCP2095239.1 hypothetical protein [Actinosynnema pretiosum]
MGIEIPGWLEKVAWLAAGEWPEGDETALRRLGTAWDRAAEDVDAVLRDADAAVAEALSNMDGESADAVRRFWAQYADGDQAALKALEEQSRGLGAECRNCALQIEYAKLSILIALGIFLAELLAMLASAVFTAGASTAGIVPAQIATRVTIQTIVRQLVQSLVQRLGRSLVGAVVRSVVTEVATSVGTDLAVQAIQIAKGDRQGIDGKLVGDAALSGAISGGTGALIGAGGDKLLGNGLEGLAKNALKDAAEEAVTGVASTVVEAAVTGEDLKFDDLLQSAVGGGVGGLVGGAKNHFDGASHGGSALDPGGSLDLGGGSADAPSTRLDLDARSAPVPTGSLPHEGGGPQQAGPAEPQAPRRAQDATSASYATTTPAEPAHAPQSFQEPAQRGPQQAAPQQFAPQQFPQSAPAQSAPAQAPASTQGSGTQAQQPTPRSTAPTPPHAPQSAPHQPSSPTPQSTSQGSQHQPQSTAPQSHPAQQQPHSPAPQQAPQSQPQAPQPQSAQPHPQSQPQAQPHTPPQSHPGQPTPSAPAPGPQQPHQPPAPQSPTQHAPAHQSPVQQPHQQGTTTQQSGTTTPQFQGGWSPQQAPPNLPNRAPDQPVPDGRPQQQAFQPQQPHFPQPSPQPSPQAGPPRSRPASPQAPLGGQHPRPTGPPPQQGHPGRPQGDPSRPHRTERPAPDQRGQAPARRSDGPPPDVPQQRPTAPARHQDAPAAQRADAPAQRVDGPAPHRDAPATPHRDPASESPRPRTEQEQVSRMRKRFSLPPELAHLQPRAALTRSGLSLHQDKLHPAVHRSADRVPEDPSTYTVDVHGTGTSASVDGNRLSPEQLADIIRSTGDWDGRKPIRLISCNTGTDPGGFAARLSRELGVEVIAPSKYAWVDEAGNVFASSKEPSPDRPDGAPGWPPNGSWITHRPDGTSTDHNSTTPPGHAANWGDTTPGKAPRAWHRASPDQPPRWAGPAHDQHGGQAGNPHQTRSGKGALGWVKQVFTRQPEVDPHANSPFRGWTPEAAQQRQQQGLTGQQPWAAPQPQPPTVHPSTPVPPGQTAGHPGWPGGPQHPHGQAQGPGRQQAPAPFGNGDNSRRTPNGNPGAPQFGQPAARQPLGQNHFGAPPQQGGHPHQPLGGQHQQPGPGRPGAQSQQQGIPQGHRQQAGIPQGYQQQPGHRPAGGQPGIGQPVGGQPMGSQTAGGQPVGGQPVGGQPVGSQPLGSHRTGGQPGGQPQGFAQPRPAQPGLPQPGLPQPGPAQPGLPQARPAQTGPAQPGYRQGPPPQAGSTPPGAGRPGPQQFSPNPAPGRPGFAQPGSPQPGFARPTTPQTGPAQPDAVRQGSPQPTPAQPDAARPSSPQPALAQPGAAQPGSPQPGQAQPGPTPQQRHPQTPPSGFQQGGQVAPSAPPVDNRSQRPASPPPPVGGQPQGERPPAHRPTSPDAQQPGAPRAETPARPQQTADLPAPEVEQTTGRPQQALADLPRPHQPSPQDVHAQSAPEQVAPEQPKPERSAEPETAAKPVEPTPPAAPRGIADRLVDGLADPTTPVGRDHAPAPDRTPDHRPEDSGSPLPEQPAHDLGPDEWKSADQLLEDFLAAFHEQLDQEAAFRDAVKTPSGLEWVDPRKQTIPPDGWPDGLSDEELRALPQDERRRREAEVLLREEALRTYRAEGGYALTPEEAQELTRMSYVGDDGRFVHLPDVPEHGITPDFLNDLNRYLEERGRPRYEEYDFKPGEPIPEEYRLTRSAPEEITRNDLDLTGQEVHDLVLGSSGDLKQLVWHSYGDEWHLKKNAYYRMDSRGPEQVAAEGFTPIGDPADYHFNVESHISGNTTSSGFVSACRDLKDIFSRTGAQHDPGGARTPYEVFDNGDGTATVEGWVHAFHVPAGIDADATLRDNPVGGMSGDSAHQESEITVPGGVPPRNISSSFLMRMVVPLVDGVPDFKNVTRRSIGEHVENPGFDPDPERPATRTGGRT